MGNVYLVGQEGDIWSKPDMSDLIALGSQNADDPFTAFVKSKGVHWWYRVVGRYLRVIDLI